MKMTKIADSAAISENIPTRPRDGRFQSTSAAGMLGANWLIGMIPSFVFPVGVVRMFQVPKRAAALYLRDGGEVVFRRRRRGGPLERPGIPRIASCALTPKVRPK